MTRYGGQRTIYIDNGKEPRKKNNMQPLHEYITIIIRDHLDDMQENGMTNINKIIEKTYRYSRKIGYSQKPDELIPAIRLIIIGMMECCRQPGEPFTNVPIERVRTHLQENKKKQLNTW